MISVYSNFKILSRPDWTSICLRKEKKSMWKILQACAKPVRIPSAIETRLQDWRPKVAITVIAVVFALAGGGRSRSPSANTADSDTAVGEGVVGTLFLALVAYSVLCSSFALVKAFAFLARPDRPCLFDW